jgi:hypothetical protein
MKMRSEVLVFSNADERTEGYAGNRRHIFVAFFPALTQTGTQSMYIAADCCSQRDKVPVMFSFLLYSTFTVQTVQSTTELYLQ